ncbi:MAG: hypothetical protein MI923_27765 [Phycisphaerales bacterium]|nr:hypothetical protein [Phycisphaerales bacterium]
MKKRPNTPMYLAARIIISRKRLSQYRRIDDHVRPTLERIAYVAEGLRDGRLGRTRAMAVERTDSRRFVNTTICARCAI